MRRQCLRQNQDEVVPDNRHLIMKQEWKQRIKEERMSLCGSALAQGYQWHSLRFNISPSILSHRKCHRGKWN